ncbi:hypothetical protein [Patulibacter defluvii]|uniref:hypothetical protein n=1 Tax=Patulibacter defluvii TaxID=3095358 RepID=UPI002A75BEA4|nr:hypothetical protein [Patulibacter sp. DM4]
MSHHLDSADPEKQVADALGELSEWGIDAIIDMLQRPYALPASHALEHHDGLRGLFTVWGDARAWSELGLERCPRTAPLYIGLAERDPRTSLRHQVLALFDPQRRRAHVPAGLRQLLGDGGSRRPRAIPASSPVRRAIDTQLARWVRDRLTISVWWPTPRARSLELLHEAVMLTWPQAPPLNAELELMAA